MNLTNTCLLAKASKRKENTKLKSFVLQLWLITLKLDKFTFSLFFFFIYWYNLDIPSDHILATAVESFVPGGDVFSRWGPGKGRVCCSLTVDVDHNRAVLSAWGLYGIFF